MPTQARVAQAARYRKQPATPPHRRSTMLHEPIQQQIGRLGLRGAADMLARLPLNDEVIDALALLLEAERSEEHTSEIQSLMRISYAVFSLKKKIQKNLLPCSLLI